MLLTVTINGEKRKFEISPGDTLLEVLRREGYYEVKKGCGTGNCGTCTVLLDGIAVTSCTKLAGLVEGREVVTIAGIGTPDNPHPLQEAFVEEGAVQCGYCIPGMILSAKALLDNNPNPTEEEIKESLDGNLCRCTGYVNQIKAVKLAAALGSTNT
ncbi:MAG TPA: (2Fe-2S)-binding protein [Candidatus Eremiobacteraeota bacterium]|nr:MAG: Nicotinate dehydrogenase small FeS subunit [bacterium ADurb.Bin363]HPZ09480.1 (2Fe-2S)-binding protein [Candidatus Eremiobacteraeota bacterium]